MKHVSPLLVLFIGILATVTSVAQSGLGFLRAEVTKKNNERLNVLIELKENYTDFVNYKLDSGGRVNSIPIQDVMSIKTKFNTEYENLLIDNAERILLKMTSGKANMYAYVEYAAPKEADVYVGKRKVKMDDGGSVTTSSRIVVYLVLKSDSSVVLTVNDFKDKLADFFKDCPKMEDKVTKATFEQIVDLVNQYNKCR